MEQIKRKTISKLPVKPKSSRPIVSRIETKIDLAQFRHRRGLSLRDVASVCGLGYATVNRAERGYEVDVFSALRLAEFYETTVDAIWKERA